MEYIKDIMVTVFLPICICCVLPVTIVWLICRRWINNDNRRADVLIEAIKTYNGMDIDRLVETLAKPNRTPAELLNLRLLRGCIFTLVGLALTVVCVVGEKCRDGGGVCVVICLNCGGMTDPAGIFMVLGAVSVAIGVSYLITYFVTKKQF